VPARPEKEAIGPCLGHQIGTRPNTPRHEVAIGPNSVGLHRVGPNRARAGLGPCGPFGILYRWQLASAATPTAPRRFPHWRVRVAFVAADTRWWRADGMGCNRARHARWALARTFYVTRVRVRVSDTIRIGYADTHFLKRKPTKMVYPSIRIRVSGEDQIQIRHPLWSIRVT
jgi:hypothetical protein